MAVTKSKKNLKSQLAYGLKKEKAFERRSQILSKKAALFSLSSSYAIKSPYRPLSDFAGLAFTLLQKKNVKHSYNGRADFSKPMERDVDGEYFFAELHEGDFIPSFKITETGLSEELLKKLQKQGGIDFNEESEISYFSRVEEAPGPGINPYKYGDFPIFLYYEEGAAAYLSVMDKDLANFLHIDVDFAILTRSLEFKFIREVEGEALQFTPEGFFWPIFIRAYPEEHVFTYELHGFKITQLYFFFFSHYSSKELVSFIPLSQQSLIRYGGTDHLPILMYLPPFIKKEGGPFYPFPSLNDLILKEAVTRTAYFEEVMSVKRAAERMGIKEAAGIYEEEPIDEPDDFHIYLPKKIGSAFNTSQWTTYVHDEFHIRQNQADFLRQCEDPTFKKLTMHPYFFFWLQLKMKAVLVGRILEPPILLILLKLILLLIRIYITA